MDIRLILAVTFLLALIVNFAHWRFHAGTSYFPHTGWFRLVFVTWAIFTAVSAAAVLAGWLPFLAFLLITFGFVMWQELYSIGVRYMITGK